ncbi:metal-sensitive transcriptional regulator [Enteractinococcus coprophilus]|uniref:DNA-binding FrmR family transcriptional regulator n=1 Tax=Enteractinococcus coprophilus TaxID=1027633 RepID=A0A543AMV7_9MICC|nr:metal-sensitive transcriptional regulator [Enteractinococcus coprophilus]TQL73917.1 DNA-binding FrmR family transcriptional regulator [Enteractinococcus coprophilus]
MTKQQSDHNAVGYTDDKAAYLKRLARIEGQVRGIKRMIENDAYCIDVLTQVSAVNKALHALSLGLVTDHMNHCVIDAAASGDEAVIEEKVQEVSATIGRLLR